MSSAMMLERTGIGLPGVGVPGLGTPTVGTPTGLPTGTNWTVVPRCTVKVEKCTGGLKIHCSCDDKLACSMVQNLCTMLAGGMCSVYCITNGMTVCCCNLTMGMCKYETHESGVVLTCTSGDTKCCEMIQACCDCLCTLMDAGCTCCVCLNNTPVCCGSSEPSKSGGSKQPKPAR
jgi:hypothetical protein